MVRFKGGGLLCERSSILTRDGAVVLACCVDSVLAFSAASGDQLYALQHGSPVTALCAHPKDDTLLYSSTVGGDIILWDLTTGTEAQRWQVDSPVESLVVGDADTAYVSCHWRQRQAGRLFAYNLAGSTASSGRAKTSVARRLVAAQSSELLAAVDRHTAMVWRMDRFPQNPLVLTHTKKLTCAALTDSGDVLAVGDVTGRIVFWHGIREAVDAVESGGEPALPQATVHWHAEPVCCLEFSPDGTFMLSGGHEGVLVVWDVSSGRRAYLPRLGSCLLNIACCTGDPSRAAVSLSDNVIRVVDLASMHVQCSIRGICSIASSLRSASPSACIALQPGTGHLALASAAATLQLYDPRRNKHIDRLQLSGLSAFRTPHASSTASKLPAPTHAVFNADGEMLVTVEQRLAVSGRVTSLVKAWRRSQVASYGHSYTLAAGEGNPCSTDDAVIAVAVHPQEPLVAVALGSASVLLWKLMPTSRGGLWTVTSVPALAAFGAHALAFSPDGTVLAACATACSPVMLVESADLRVLGMLPPPLDKRQAASLIMHLAFLADGLRLAVQWEHGAAVYDPLSVGKHWAALLPTALLASDAGTPRLALGMPSGAVLMLGPTGEAHAAAGVLHERTLRAAHFLIPKQSTVADSVLVVLNDAQQFSSANGQATAPIGHHGEQQQRSKTAAAVQQLTAAGQAHLADFGTDSVPHPPCQGRGRVAAAYHDSASHMLASAVELCPLALEQLLL
ncbi:hypothetical protein ABPG77_000967 [Micractinium sp. CCAP 211/92]